jgi:hypothetical protein
MNEAHAGCRGDGTGMGTCGQHDQPGRYPGWCHYWQVAGEPVQVVLAGHTRTPEVNSGDVQSVPAATVPTTDSVTLPLWPL